MKFTDYPYKRPNLKRVSKNFETLIKTFSEAQNLEDAESALTKINRIRRDFTSMASIGQIRHTIDTRDAFYDSENQFFDNCFM